MNRETQIEQAQERIKKLKELTLKFKTADPRSDSEKESVWKRKPVKLSREPRDIDPLNATFKALTENSQLIEELILSIKYQKANDLVEMEQLLKEVSDLYMDFKLSNNNLAFKVKLKLNQVRDIRLGLMETVNWNKINDLTRIERKLEESKQLILKIQSDEANGIKFNDIAD